MRSLNNLSRRGDYPSIHRELLNGTYPEWEVPPA